MFDKDNVKNRFDEGVSAYMNQSFEKAVELFSAAIEEEPEFALAYVSRGAAYARLERSKDSLKDFDRAIELKPDYARAYHLRGLEFDKKGEHDRAIADFDKAIELDPEYGAAYYSRAAILSKTGREDRAQEDIEMVTMLTERNLNTYANENNVWRSRHLKLEEEGIADAMDR